jgi:signal transduction histidine kinase
METIEIPRFLLDYFDSNTIRTPLTSIRGYATVMLEGAVGPLTEDQHKFLEIIKRDAERLDQHFSLVLHNQHYIVWDEQVIHSPCTIRELIDDFALVIANLPNIIFTPHISDDSLSVLADRRHIRNAFASIGDFISHTYNQSQGNEISVNVFHKNKATTFSFKFHKGVEINNKDLAYYESFLYVARRVMELHGGLFSITHEAGNKLGLELVFPDITQPSSAT